MKDRIDHAAEAHRVISTMPSSDLIADAYAYAQVHATLALVEQQRIANLIALAQGTDGSFSTTTRDLAYLSIVGGGPDAMPHPEIAAALGIEVDHG